MAEKLINLYILAAGSSDRGEKACSTWHLPNGMSILDWQLHNFSSAISNLNTKLLVGFNFSKVIKKYPDISFYKTILKILKNLFKCN